MKLKKTFLITLAATCLSISFSLLVNGQSQDFSFTPLKYRPSPVDNPLKGLVPYARPTPGRFPHSMEFNYLPLAKVVVGPEKYDWKPLDELLNDIAARGNQSVFRIFLEYPGKKNCIPKFLIDGGLTVHKYKNTNTAPFPPQDVETPDYEDEDLRKVLVQFVSAMGKKYDGDPRIGFITAGLLGTWGEWHTYPRDDLWASKKVQTEILDAYESAFKKTPILLRYPAGKTEYHHAPTVGRAFGYHDDSFCHATLDTGKESDSWFFEASMKRGNMTNVWKKYPIGGEIRPETWGCCFDENPCVPEGQEFSKCRDQLHVTWLMDTGMFREKAVKKRYDRAITEVRKMGYEFHVSGYRILLLKDQLGVSVKIDNRGIAPFYHPDWRVYFGIAKLDETTNKYVLVKSWKSGIELAKIAFGTETTIHRKLDLDGLEKLFVGGDYKLLMSVPNRIGNGKPVRFANETQDADLKNWLTLGTIEK